MEKKSSRKLDEGCVRTCDVLWCGVKKASPETDLFVLPTAMFTWVTEVFKKKKSLGRRSFVFSTNDCLQTASVCLYVPGSFRFIFLLFYNAPFDWLKVNLGLCWENKQCEGPTAVNLSSFSARTKVSTRPHFNDIKYHTCIDTAWTWTCPGWDDSWGSATRRVNSPVLKRGRKANKSSPARPFKTAQTENELLVFT